MRRGILAASILAVLPACAGTSPAPSEFDASPRFAALRPVMLLLVTKGPQEITDPLRDALRRGLLEKRYSVLAPGAPAGPQTGTVTVRVSTSTPPLSAELTFEDPFGTRLFRSRATAGSPDRLAADLLARLPGKDAAGAAPVVVPPPVPKLPGPATSTSP